MSTFEELRVKADSPSLVRKAQKAVAFIAPMSVAIPEKLMTAPGQFIDLFTEKWLPFGLVTPEGYEFEREIETSEIDALGYSSPVRTDVEKIPRSVSMTVLETGKKHLLEVMYGVDLSDVKADPETGEIVFDEPDMPDAKEYRLLFIALDGPMDNQWAMGRAFYRAKLASGGAQTWAREGANQSPLKFNVSADEETGMPSRHYLGGSGVLASLEQLGFEKATI